MLITVAWKVTSQYSLLDTDFAGTTRDTPNCFTHSKKVSLFVLHKKYQDVLPL
jgi:hypothetical protein